MAHRKGGVLPMSTLHPMSLSLVLKKKEDMT